MSYDPERGFPAVVAELFYRDAAAALDWLARVFGFAERLRWHAPSGGVGHGELELDGGVVMVAPGGERYRGVGVAGQAGLRVRVRVADIERHLETARREGAVIVCELRQADANLCRYEALDLDGHLWEFSQR